MSKKSYVTCPPLTDLYAFREYFGIHTGAPWAFDEEGHVWKLRGFPEQEELIAIAVLPTELDEWLDGQPPEVVKEWRQGRMQDNARLIAAVPQLLNSFIAALEKEQELVAEIERLRTIVESIPDDVREDMRTSEAMEGVIE